MTLKPMGDKHPSAEVVKSLEACVANDSAGCVAASDAFATGNGAPFNLWRAYKLLNSPCEAGDARSCYRRGFLEIITHSKEQAEENATPFYRKACAADSKYCSHLGQHLLRARENVEEGRSLLRKGCDAGSARGCRALAFEYLWDAPITAVPPEFEALSHKACVLLGKSRDECREIMDSCLQKSDDFEACDRFPKLHGVRYRDLPKVSSWSDASKNCHKKKQGNWCFAPKKFARKTQRRRSFSMNVVADMALGYRART